MISIKKFMAQYQYNVGTYNLMHFQNNPRLSLQKAIKYLKKSTELDHTFAYSFHNLAHAWYLMAERFLFTPYQQKFWEKVYKRKLTYNDTQDVDAFINEIYELALKSVDQAIQINHIFPQAHNTRAMILAKLDRLNEAIQATDVALGQDPNYENAQNNREKMLYLQKQRQATT